MYMNKLATDKKTIEYLYSEMEKMPEIYKPSAFWTDLGNYHREQLESADLNNFKRSINVRYFNWRTLGIIRHQMQPILRQLFRANWSPIFKSSFVNPTLPHAKQVTHFNPLASLVYKTYIASLYEFVKKDDHKKLFDTISEPPFGNPFLVKYNNGLRTQDLSNSVHEFYSITDWWNFAQENPNIVELGAGYGRTAYVFLKALPKASYCIVDIPPAVYVSQEYLSRVFPGEKIFKYRPFTDWESVKDEFTNSRIRFLMPNQLELLPPKFFDLFINISSLHELTREQIANFITQIDRNTRGYFYTKQWRKSRVKDNGHIRMNEYPIPERWRLVYRRNRHPIQRMFFDALYEIK